METYKYQGKKGITDLWNTDPYYQGDGQWPLFSSHFGVTEEEYKANPERYAARIRQANDDYIERLKSLGEFGKEFTIDIKMKHNSLFDKPLEAKGEELNLTSHRMLFIKFE